MGILVHLVAGLIFGAGLVISGMANPAKVQNFLDLAGQWDPSLIFVMGGAVVVAFVGFRIAGYQVRPFFGQQFNVPTSHMIDARLLTGAAIFGIGWGLAGFCPGPAITSLGLAASGTLIFIPAMLAGMFAARMLATYSARAREARARAATQ